MSERTPAETSLAEEDALEALYCNRCWAELYSDWIDGMPFEPLACACGFSLPIGEDWFRRGDVIEARRQSLVDYDAWTRLNQAEAQRLMLARALVD